MRILHVADRLSNRGGADWALLGLLDALSDGHELHLAVGRDDGAVRPPCPVTVVPQLDARTRADADLDPLLARLRPDLVHVHNVVNPAVLEWAAGVGAVVTVQDHRFFCPGRGKWTSDGRVCGDAMGREVCAGCFDDPGYFESTLQPGFLTTPRRSCLRRRVWGSGRPDGAAAMVWTRAMSCARRQNRPGKHTGPERTPVPPAVVNVCRRLADRQARSGGERKR